MGIFSWLFPSREARLAKHIISEVRRKQLPVGNLAVEIGAAAMSCGKAMKSHVHFESEDKISEQYIYVCFEFMYFFIHLTDRVASAHLGPERRRKLMDDL